MKKIVLIIALVLCCCMLYAEGTTIALCGSFDRLQQIHMPDTFTGSTAIGAQLGIDHNFESTQWLNVFATVDLNMPQWLYDGESSKAWEENPEKYTKSFRYAGKARLGAQVLLPYLMGGYLDLKAGIGVDVSYLRVRRVSLDEGIDIERIGVGTCAIVCADLYLFNAVGLRLQGSADMCFATFESGEKPIFGFAIGYNAAVGAFVNF